MILKKATTDDIKIVQSIINKFAAKNLLLPRSLSELYDHVRNFILALDEKNNKIVGACSLKVCWEDLAEVCSLAVEDQYQRQGYGKALLERCIEDGIQLGIKRVFALTYSQDFFLNLSFKVIDKSELPHKIWNDCLKCPKFPECDEIAMIRYL